MTDHLIVLYVITHSKNSVWKAHVLALSPDSFFFCTHRERMAVYQAARNAGVSIKQTTVDDYKVKVELA